MNYTLQLAHDLAVAKLYGSDLPVKELCEQYDQYYKEILDYLCSKPGELAKAEAVDLRGKY